MIDPKDSNTSAGTPLSALVVEDDFASRQYLLLLLKKLNILPVVAETGEAALDTMQDKMVDIMLLDIALGPGISGIELGEILKQEERFETTPMVAVTAFSKEKLQKLDEAGFADYLAKPYTFNQLQKMLKKYLDD